MIFSRGRGSGRHSRPRVPRGGDPAVPTGPDDLDADLDNDLDADVDGPTAGTGRDTGPYDSTEAPAIDEQMLDLGGLLIPVVENVEVRVEAGQDGDIRQVLLVTRSGALELSAFAAPRTEGIWAEVRDEIREALLAERATVTEAEGPYGTELRGRVRTPGGPVDVRFVGIDGPRWMVRAVYQGRVATDPAAAAPLDACLRGLVVNRGTAAMPVRDPIPLRLPRQAVEAAGQDVVETGPEVDGVQPGGIDGVPGGPGRHAH